MAYKLRRAVMVADGNEMVELPAGTPLAELSAPVKAQLAPAHFADLDDDGNVTSDRQPKDWRPAEVQARDDQQAAFNAEITGEG